MFSLHCSRFKTHTWGIPTSSTIKDSDQQSMPTSFADVIIDQQLQKDCKYVLSRAMYVCIFFISTEAPDAPCFFQSIRQQVKAMEDIEVHKKCKSLTVCTYLILK